MQYLERAEKLKVYLAKKKPVKAGESSEPKKGGADKVRIKTGFGSQTSE